MSSDLNERAIVGAPVLAGESLSEVSAGFEGTALLGHVR